MQSTAMSYDRRCDNILPPVTQYSPAHRPAEYATRSGQLASDHESNISALITSSRMSAIIYRDSDQGLQGP
jgi:hypothetical protein